MNRTVTLTAGGGRNLLPTLGGELGMREAGFGTVSAHFRDVTGALIATVQKEGKPTVRQVYALAAALCERLGEEFPESRGNASELIERLRTENGHPAPGLDPAPRQVPR